MSRAGAREIRCATTLTGYHDDRTEAVLGLRALDELPGHDLRHGAATLALAAGKTMKEVQALMRHSSESITSDIYAAVLPELRAEVSVAVVSMVPRTNAGRFGRKAAGS